MLLFLGEDDFPRQNLKVRGHVRLRSKIIFNFGHRIKALTVSANEGFVRAAKQQVYNFKRQNCLPINFLKYKFIHFISGCNICRICTRVSSAYRRKRNYCHNDLFMITITIQLILYLLLHVKVHCKKTPRIYLLM